MWRKWSTFRSRTSSADSTTTTKPRNASQPDDPDLLNKWLETKDGESFMDDSDDEEEEEEDEEEEEEEEESEGDHEDEEDVDFDQPDDDEDDDADGDGEGGSKKRASRAGSFASAANRNLNRKLSGNIDASKLLVEESGHTLQETLLKEEGGKGEPS